MKTKALLTAIFMISIALLTNNSFAKQPVKWLEKDASGKVTVNFYVYWSKDCEHCHKAVPFMKKIASQNRWINLKLKEVTNSTANIDEYIALAKITGGVAGSVPAFFYCGQMYTGYGENTTTGNWLLSELKACRSNPAEFDIKL